MENASEGTHSKSNKNSLSISDEESAGLTFGLPPHPLEDVQVKKKKHTLLRSHHPYYRTLSKHLRREPQLIKFEYAFHIWNNIGTFVNAHFLQCRVSRNTSMHSLTDCNLQSHLHCAVTLFQQNFTKLVPESIRGLLTVSRIIYLFISINVIV